MSTDNDRHGYIYFGISGNKVKIGFSHDPEKRIAKLNGGSAQTIWLMASMPGRMSDEKWLHEVFDDYREHGEWFTYTGHVEAYVEAVARVQLPSWEEPAPATPSRGLTVQPAAPLTPDEIVEAFGGENFQLLSDLHREYSEGITLRALALQLIRDARIHPRNPWMTYGLRAALRAGICKANYVIACGLNGARAAQ